MWAREFSAKAVLALTLMSVSSAVLADDLYVAVLPMEVAVAGGRDYTPGSPAIGGLMSVNTQPTEFQIREILDRHAASLFQDFKALEYRILSISWLGAPSYAWRVRAQVLTGLFVPEIYGHPPRHRIARLNHDFVRVTHLDDVPSQSGSRSWLARFFQLSSGPRRAYLASRGGYVRWPEGDALATAMATVAVGTLGEAFCAHYFQPQESGR